MNENDWQVANAGASGLVTGLVVLTVAVCISLMWKLIQSKSEVARRVRIVIGAVLALGFAAFLFAGWGPGGVITVGAVIGVIVWVAKGKGK